MKEKLWNIRLTNRLSKEDGSDEVWLWEHYNDKPENADRVQDDFLLFETWKEEVRMMDRLCNRTYEEYCK